MSGECEDCYLENEIRDLENEIEEREKECQTLDSKNSHLSTALKEIIDVDKNPFFRTFSAEEKIERMQQIANLALRRKW
jgi:hypothetical protein